MTFGDYRKSRYLTQGEAALLARVSLCTVKRWEHKSLAGGDVLNVAHYIEGELAEGPHDGVSRKLLDPFTMKPMSQRSVVRMPAGAVFASLEYYQPDVTQEAALRTARPDLWAMWSANKEKRLILLYRVTTTRYARDTLRKGYGVAVKDIRVPSFAPIPAP